MYPLLDMLSKNIKAYSSWVVKTGKSRFPMHTFLVYPSTKNPGLVDGRALGGPCREASSWSLSSIGRSRSSYLAFCWLLRVFVELSVLDKRVSGLRQWEIWPLPLSPNCRRLWGGMQTHHIQLRWWLKSRLSVKIAFTAQTWSCWSLNVVLTGIFFFESGCQAIRF